MQFFFIEVTDVHGGEANHSWVTRHIVKAKSVRGAINWLARNSGLNWSFDGIRYNSRSGATCAFVDRLCEEDFLHYESASLATDHRKAV